MNSSKASPLRKRLSRWGIVQSENDRLTSAYSNRNEINERASNLGAAVGRESVVRKHGERHAGTPQGADCGGGQVAVARSGKKA